MSQAETIYTLRLEQLRQQLVAELKSQDDPRMFGKGGVFEAFPSSDEANRNFYDRFMKGEKMNANWVEPSGF